MKAGHILWTDLTVDDADASRQFYEAVVGWTSRETDGDFEMLPPGEDTAVTGVCRCAGVNAKIPPMWLVYFEVENLEASVEEAIQRGGVLIDGPRSAGHGNFVCMKGPSGEAFALFQSVDEVLN